MKPTPEEIAMLAKHIAETEAQLQRLEWEIQEIGEPAAQHLRQRLDALRIEENALKRNVAEALGKDEPDEMRMKKIEALLSYIEREENAVGHDADFLHQSAPSSTEIPFRAGKYIGELCLRALKRVIGEHHPLGMSVFVNRSPDALNARFGLHNEAIPAPETGKG